MIYPTDQSCPVYLILTSKRGLWWGEALIITITLESEKGEVDETYQDPQKMSGDQKEKQKTENSKCQEPSL